MHCHFIHIPKTGGSTIVESPELKTIVSTYDSIGNKMAINDEYIHAVTNAEQQVKQHLPLHHSRWKDLHVSLRKGKCFAIVRNPWSRTVSRYNYYRKMIKQYEYNINDYHPAHDMSFDKFLDLYFVYKDSPFIWHNPIFSWNQQKDYVVDYDGNIVVDILRYEYYAQDINNYMQQYGIDFYPKIYNASDNKNKFYDFYTEKTRKMIESIYEEDIEFFGFRFDGAASRNIWSRQ